MKPLLKAVFVVIPLWASACGDTTAGNVCTSDNDCDTEFRCLAASHLQPASGGERCVAAGRSCTIVCTGDADCASLGDDFHCVANCASSSSTCQK